MAEKEEISEKMYNLVANAINSAVLRERDGKIYQGAKEADYLNLIEAIQHLEYQAAQYLEYWVGASEVCEMFVKKLNEVDPLG